MSRTGLRRCPRSAWPTGSPLWQRRSRCMSALHQRQSTGRGQVVDVAIVEPIMALLGPQIIALGPAAHRSRSASATAPPTTRRGTVRDRRRPLGRHLHQLADHRRTGPAAGGTCGPRRRAVVRDRPDAGRARDVLDEAVGGWIAAHTRAEVIADFDAPKPRSRRSTTRADIVDDPHFQALGTILTVDDPDLGPLQMQNVLFQLRRPPAAVRWPAVGHGADTDAVLSAYGFGAGRARRVASPRGDLMSPAPRSGRALRPRATGPTGSPRRWPPAPTR